MRKILQDPLIHFLAFGGLLFVLLSFRSEDQGAQRIVVSEEQVSQLAQAAAVMRGGALSRAELEAIVEPAIRDEVYYREALALGLDVDDDSVRTRLIEKMRYLTEDLADPEPASDEELREFFDSDPARFLIPETITFDQRFFSPSQRGANLETDVASALEHLRAGNDPDGIGDSTPLRDRFEEAPREQVQVLFGEAMTNALFTMAPGEWQGPYESDFGLHLVRLIERREARQPAFDEIRAQALEVFAEERRRLRNEAAYRAIRDRYEIVIEWPEAEVAGDSE